MSNGGTDHHNGEVYNYRELRTELEARGYRFRRTPIRKSLHAHEAAGQRASSASTASSRWRFGTVSGAALFLARDTVLRRCTTRSPTAPFSSRRRRRRFLRMEVFSRHRSPRRSLKRCFQARCSPGARCSMASRRWSRGHELIVGCNGVRKETYWDILLHEILAHTERALGPDDPALEDALRIRLPDEVPWGLMLSGGTDSSTLVHSAHGMACDPPQTFLPSTSRTRGRGRTRTSTLHV